MAHAVKPESERFPIGEPLVLRFGNTETPGNLFNLSMTGMFVACPKTFPAGQDFHFVCNLDERGATIQGTAKVAWRRRESNGASRPAGMGAVFQRLDSNSRRTIREVIEKRKTEMGGGLSSPERRLDLSTLELEGLGSGPPAPAPTPRPEAFRAVAAETRSGLDKRWAGALLTVLALVAVGLAAIRWWPEAQRERGTGTTATAPAANAVAATPVQTEPQPATDTASITTREPAAAAALPGVTRPAAPLPTAPAPRAPEPSTAPAAAPTPAPANDPAPAIRAAVDRWVKAWSQQDVASYLAAYGSGFGPPNGLSRTAWEAQRRARITAPASIEVRIEQVETRPRGDAAVVTFLQSYTADQYRDLVRKTLRLARENGAWKIVGEESAAAPAR